MNPLERLRHHVTGAVERGEAVPIAGRPFRHVVATVDGVEIAETRSTDDIECVRKLDVWIARQCRNKAFFEPGPDGQPCEATTDAELRWRRAHHLDLQDVDSHSLTLET